MVRVTRSAIIDAPIERVWAVLRDFNSHWAWHPAVGDSHIEHGERSDQVGCVRNFFLKDGSHIREQLLTLSDYDYECTYSILDCPMPLSNYIATLKLTPVTDGNRTFAEWSAEFDCDEAKERQLAEDIGQGVFQVGFNAFKQRFSKR